MREEVLQRTAERITAYIQNYVTVAGAEKRDEVLQLFDKMQELFPGWGIMTCPMMHPEIFYISQNSSHVLGHSHEHLAKNSGLPQYFELVHDADKEDLHSCFNFTHNYLESVLPEQHDQYRSIFHYRIKKSNGQYIYLHDEKAVLNLGASNLYYVLFRDISAEKVFSGVKIELYKRDIVMRKIEEYKPSSIRNPLSKREGELVMLIKQGLSTKEIAWYLKISHHTVRNIKSKLFEKFNVNNTVELLNMTA